MKKFLAVVLSLIMVLSLASCKYETGFVVNKDGSVDVSLLFEFDENEFNNYMAVSMMAEGMSSYIYDYSEDEIDQVLEMYGLPFTKSTKDGVAVYTISESEKVAAEDMDSTFTESGYVVSPAEFILESEEAVIEDSLGIGELDPSMVDMLGDFKMDFFITMPEKIVCTDGKLSSDKKTATWVSTVENPLNSVYALTASSDKIISLNVNGITKKNKVKVSSYEKIKSITVNGKTQKSKTINLTAEGKYTIEVVTKNSSKTFELIKDATAPAVKGVKDGASYEGSVKIKYSDDNGIKKATLNGKKVKKTGTTANKKGTNTLVVTDKAGNKTTVTFTIK